MLQLFTPELWDSIKLFVSSQESQGSDLNLASLMAHEDADTGRKAKKSQQQGVKDDRGGKPRKRRSQPEPAWPKLQFSKSSVESSSADLKLTPEVGMSDPPSKRSKISESVHLPSKVVVAKAQDLDEDYDNI